MVRRPNTTPRKKPLQKRAEDTVDVLLVATERVVAQRGFYAASTNEIARVAGVGVGTLYRYFPTKEALVEAVVHRMWERELALLRAHGAQVGTRPLEEVIAATINALCAHVSANDGLYRAWCAEAAHLGALREGMRLLDSGAALVEEVLTAQPTGLRETPSRFAAHVLARTVMGTIRKSATEYPEELISGELARMLTRLVTRYLLG